MVKEITTVVQVDNFRCRDYHNGLSNLNIFIDSYSLLNKLAFHTVVILMNKHFSNSLIVITVKSYRLSRPAL